MNVLINSTGGSLHNVQVYQITVHTFKYLTILFVNYSSIKLGRKKKNPELFLYSFVIKCWDILERF